MLTVRSIRYRILSPLLIVGTLASTKALEGSGQTLEGGKLYTASEANLAISNVDFYLEFDGSSVVGNAASGYWVVCFSGTVGGERIEVRTARMQHENIHGAGYSFEPLWDHLEGRFRSVHITMPEPYPNPKSLLRTPPKIVEDKRIRLEACKGEIGSGSEMVTPTPQICADLATTEELIRDPKDRISANRDWIRVRGVLSSFYESQRAIVVEGEAPTLARAAIAHQFLNLAELSIRGRSSEGGWSGELARESLLDLANRADADTSKWSRTEAELSLRDEVFCDVMDDLLGLGIDVESTCSLMKIGEAHLEQHLSPFFEDYLRSKLSLGIEGCREELVDRLEIIYQAVLYEHENFLEHAVVAGFDSVYEMAPEQRSEAKKAVPGRARGVRWNALVKVLGELVQAGSLSDDERIELHSRILELDPEG